MNEGDQSTHMKEFHNTIKTTFLCQQNFLTKRKDCLPLQRTLKKPLSLREILQGMFLQLQKNWEQWRSNSIFPPWITVKLKCGTYQLDQNIEEFSKIIEEDKKIADDENEQPEVRARARERITENTGHRDQAVQEREQIAERLPLRKRLKDLFKKHGFTIATVVGASAAANGIKTVGKKVGDGLKELGKRIGSILPGLVGAIASFVFLAAGQAISFLTKNAWLLILAVVAFMIQNSPRRSEHNKAYKNERTNTHKCLVYVMRIVRVFCCVCCCGWCLCLCCCICCWCCWFI